jgi:hypothetical protein
MEINTESKLSNHAIGDAGEFYVAFQLSRRNVRSVVLPNNFKAIDLFVTINGIKSASIQVKTTADTRSMYWYVGSNKPTPSDSFFFIFVNIWKDETQLTEAYVVPSQYVNENVDWTIPRPKFKLPNDKGIREGFREDWKSIIDIL